MKRIPRLLLNGLFIAATGVSLSGCLVFVQAAELPRADAFCAEIPEPERWINAGTPDAGRNPPLLSAHRGGPALAPENTLIAYRHAFAYEMDFVEVDVRETLDGVFISMHDETVDRTTNGTGKIAELTWAQIQALNAADFAPWKGSEYDPVGVPRLEDVLALARDTRKGIEFDIKDLKNPTQFLDLVASYGLLTRSYFNVRGEFADQAQAYNPEIRVIFNTLGDESPQTLFTEAGRSSVFGSRRDEFTAEKIAAIHDGCSVVLPHSYDKPELFEADEFLKARELGADGAQINQPNVIAYVAKRHLPAKLVYDASQKSVCLKNNNNDLGIPRALLNIQRGLSYLAVKITDRNGCVTLPSTPGIYNVRHEDTPAIRQATLRVSVRN